MKKINAVKHFDHQPFDYPHFPLRGAKSLLYCQLPFSFRRVGGSFHPSEGIANLHQIISTDRFFVSECTLNILLSSF